MDEVWLVEIDATGPEGGDYWGCVHAHATRDGGLCRLAEELKGQFGIDAISPDATADNGSMTGSIETDDGWTVEWGLQWTPVGS